MLVDICVNICLDICLNICLDRMIYKFCFIKYTKLIKDKSKYILKSKICLCHTQYV